MDISIVIPIYNSESCLHELYNRLKASLEKTFKDFEIIMVDDGSKDRSWDIIVELARLDKRLKGFQFSRNFGQHYAITAGLDSCIGDWVVVMDCDLQDVPEEIPRLYAKAKEGFDVVLARRIGRKDSLVKRLTSRIFYSLLNYLVDIKYDWRIGNFRIISKKVVEYFRSMREKLRFFGGLVDWMGFSTARVDVEHAGRFYGKTTYTFRKLWSLAIDTIIAYSDKPLRLSIRLGFLMALISFVFGGCIFLKALFYKTAVMGWSSLIVSLFFIGGIIILNLGIIGIYIGKTFDETKKRPLYIIKESTFHENR